MSDLVDFTEEQKRLIDAIVEWYAKADPSKPFLTVGGYAGVGKSTVMAALPKFLNIKPAPTYYDDDEDRPSRRRPGLAFCAPTGKAAEVLRGKLTAAETAHSFCGTIHSLIYKPLTNKRGEVIGWTKQDDMPFDLVIADEASMISQEMWEDLTAYGIPILAVGDHGQLPPVGSGFNLMASPMLRLETVHRQAADNPIIALATAIRLNQPVQGVPVDPAKVWYGQGREAVEQVVRQMTADGFGLDKVVLCHRNRTRVDLNREIRGLLGRRDPLPEVGDVVIGLRNAKLDEVTRLWNGQRGVVVRTFDSSPGPVYGADGKPEQRRCWTTGIEMRYGTGRYDTLTCDANRLQFGRPGTFTGIEEFAREARVSAEAEKLRHIAQLGALVDYGYAVTCHKMQGSAASDVVILIERSIFAQRDDNPPDFSSRWIYTALTRSSARAALIWV